jgi:hypothetical protein
MYESVKILNTSLHARLDCMRKLGIFGVDGKMM